MEIVVLIIKLFFTLMAFIGVLIAIIVITMLIFYDFDVDIISGKVNLTRHQWGKKDK